MLGGSEWVLGGGERVLVGGGGLIPVVGDDFVRVGQLLVGQQDVPGVCDGEEVLGSTHEGALVPSRLLDVYRGR